MDYRELVSLGLSEKEGKVYLASLALGQASVQQIAEKSKVNRATTYTIIEALTEKGLMSSVNEAKKQYFCAESPEKLSLLFREQAMEIQRKHEYLEKLLPELRSLRGSGEGPVVRYFEGKDGMRAIAEEMFLNKSTEKIRMIYSYDLLLEMFSEAEIVAMRKRRQKNNVPADIITNDELNRLETDAVVQRLAKNEAEITSDIAIFGDRVRIITQRGKIAGLIIENREIANTLRILFDLAKEALKKRKGTK